MDLNQTHFVHGFPCERRRIRNIVCCTAVVGIPDATTGSVFSPSILVVSSHPKQPPSLRAALQHDPQPFAIECGHHWGELLWGTPRQPTVPRDRLYRAVLDSLNGHCRRAALQHNLPTNRVIHHSRAPARVRRRRRGVHPTERKAQSRPRVTPILRAPHADVFRPCERVCDGWRPSGLRGATISRVVSAPRKREEDTTIAIAIAANECDRGRSDAEHTFVAKRKHSGEHVWSSGITNRRPCRVVVHRDR